MVYEKEHIESLNGKLFGMLSPLELEIVRHYRDTGRKHGIKVMVGGRENWNNSEEDLIKKTNDRIVVESFY